MNMSKKENKIGKNCFKKIGPKFPKLKPMKMNKKGQMNIMISLLIGFMVITTLVMLIPGFVDIIDMGQNSEGLNCKGYVDSDMSDGNLSYNATIGTKSTIGCLALRLYLPYLVLGVLIGVVTKILYDRGTGQQPSYNPYG